MDGREGQERKDQNTGVQRFGFIVMKNLMKEYSVEISDINADKTQLKQYTKVFKKRTNFKLRINSNPILFYISPISILKLAYLIDLEPEEIVNFVYEKEVKSNSGRSSDHEIKYLNTSKIISKIGFGL